VGKVSGDTMRRGLWVALAVAALAGVIFAGAALSSPSSDTPAEPSKLSTAVESESYARDAQVALSNNETATAVALAEQALTLDPQNRTALSVVAASRVPAPTVSEAVDDPQDPQDPDDTEDQAATPTQKADLDKGFTEKVGALSSLLPAAVSGWVAGQVVEQGPDALVTLDPAKGSIASEKALRAIVSVHDMKTAAKAKDFVTRVSKRTYSKSGGTVKVGVIPDAYFGTNGSTVAVVSFSRGRFAFDVVVPAQSGVKPTDAKAVAVSVAAAVPATK